MDRIYVAMAALVCGLVAAFLGWLDSGEPFDTRKYGGSAIRALFAALVFAVGYELSHTTIAVLDVFYAFLGGAGVDAMGNRVAGKLGNGSFPLAQANKDKPQES